MWIEILVKAYIILIVLGIVFYFLGKKHNVNPWGYLFWGSVSLLIVNFITMVIIW